MATFSISLPEGDTKEIDEEAKRNHRSRSGQVAFIIDAWLEEHRGEQK
jgi:metal-responsive CopG/Arc/MetJ family transcriptional regulator